MAVTHDGYAIAGTVVQHVVQERRLASAKEAREYRDRQRRFHDTFRLAHRVVRGLASRSSHVSHRDDLSAKSRASAQDLYAWGGNSSGQQPGVPRESGLKSEDLRIRLTLQAKY